MAEEVVELSVEETNKLRAELGLKPLRIDGKKSNDNHGGGTSGVSVDASSGLGQTGHSEEVLELSVNETNKLRKKLGLPPLRQDDDDGGDSSSRKKDVHKPAENTAEKVLVAKRIEHAKLKREVERGASTVFGSSTLTSNDDGKTDSWAEKMRKQKQQQKQESKKTKRQSRGDNVDGNDDKKSLKSASAYGESDLEGMAVRNNMTNLEAGSSAILTLTDAPILEASITTANKAVGLNEHEDELENVNLTEEDKQQDGLRKKRMLEMGMGRAGGYAGFDDEEFEELGGTLGPSRRQRGATGTLSGDYEDESSDIANRRKAGFRIGVSNDGSAANKLTDFDKVQQGQAISLEANADVAGNDYMTLEEEEAEREKKKSKKDAKFKKKKKKKKDRRRRRTETDDDDDDDDEEEPGRSLAAKAASNGGSSLLMQLEQTAKPEDSAGLRKRRKIDDDGEPIAEGTMAPGVDNHNASGSNKRSQCQKAMEKGNMRTREAFGATTQPTSTQPSYADEEVDDSFLNAAISKARRLNRLRGMNKAASGADAVAEAVKSTALTDNSETIASSSSKVSFSIDDTREFSRALRARTQQKERELSTKSNDGQNAPGQQGQSSKPEPLVTSSLPSQDTMPVEDGNDVEMEDVDMEELAKEVNDNDDQVSGFGGSATTGAGVGRGLSSFVSMLKTTGEINGKHGGKEELRGRAKDERNYDNYQPLDLSKVVAIGKNATDKDVELANREIKLEYRDKHGRLLTQKEAFRDLCYQFHGHGASKKKEEKRQQQIAREQAEARVASRQVSAARDGNTASTMLGALKATQKATGKAFIVHKT